jgi:dienelactone hydrolase
VSLSRMKIVVPVACLLCVAVAQLTHANELEKVNIMQTPSGIRFGLQGEKGPAPAPTLFVFATTIEPALTSLTYNKVGGILAKHGYLCVSLDLPYHPGGELDGWAEATKMGERWLPEFVSKVSQILDYLIQEGYTDPQKVAVAGSSRGAFVAMHIAAADQRVKCAIGFVPVTDLTQLTEFAGLKDSEYAKSLSLMNVAGKLAGRPIWVAIGSNDERVNTDKAIEFTRKVVAASIARKPPTSAEYVDVELHVMPWPDHGGNMRWPGGDDAMNAHDAAAAWLLSRMGESVSSR